MAKSRTPAFACRACGDTFPKWLGRCSSCGQMNTVVEISAADAALAARNDARSSAAATLAVEDLSEIQAVPVARLATGLPELDRVLGGGLPQGAAVVIGGEPGIGKSTLLAQVAGAIGRERPVLYATAEESTDQVRGRCHRLGVAGQHLRLVATTDADALAGVLAQGDHAVVIVDSIQLVTKQGVEGEPGGVTQVRSCAATLVEAAKRGRTALIIVGHVTKEGGLAGPRLLEHLVDTVLSFEGDRYGELRVLRAIKNRFGATNELGLFRMGSGGLEEVVDPSSAFLASRDATVPGTVVVPTMEGNRCLLVEVQALVNPTEAPQPQRRVSGCDRDRVAMILAVLSRRLRYPLGTCDVFVNVTGGAQVDEPAADLAIALAIASAWREVPVPADLCAIGEVGLGGELRPAPRYDLRAAEARRLGFMRLLGPGPGAGKGRLKADRLGEAIQQALG